jgi:hypothetical protein
MLELQGEQHQSHAVEFGIRVRGPKLGIVVVLAGKFSGANGDKISHSRRENGKFGCHAVF